MRTRFQEKFGDGGSGYSFAGRPWNGYRREDVRCGSTSGWHTDGLVGRTGDGVYGLGGISMSVRTPREGCYVEADASEFELFYYQQPGGGRCSSTITALRWSGSQPTASPAPPIIIWKMVPGPHKLEVETLDRAPVRLFGWVAEKTTGVTYETLGINGAQASIILDWNEETLRSNIERRNPALIVLAYGTNEAGRKDWTLESYRDMFYETDRALAGGFSDGYDSGDRTSRSRLENQQGLGADGQDRHDRGGAARGRDGQRLSLLGSSRQDGRQRLHAAMGRRRNGAERSRALHRSWRTTCSATRYFAM